ncbi:MAG: phenylalanine--tRNA ligase subunit beta, partial [Acidimicrobiia bacterium]|nr:phenylalanine--tRNA ligase subunit beta [Acidimicrobiia bacterium]
KAIGYVGELLPSVARSFGIGDRVAVLEVSLDALIEEPPTRLVTPPSNYPHSEFDLSFVIPPEMTASEIFEATRIAGGSLVESARVFDEFSRVGEGRRAIAIRYRLRSPDRTLTGEEVAEVRTVMIAAGESLGARLRGAE